MEDFHRAFIELSMLGRCWYGVYHLSPGQSMSAVLRVRSNATFMCFFLGAQQRIIFLFVKPKGFPTIPRKSA